MSLPKFPPQVISCLPELPLLGTFPALHLDHSATTLAISVLATESLQGMNGIILLKRREPVYIAIRQKGLVTSYYTARLLR